MLSHKGQAVGNDGSYSNIDKQAEALLRLAPIHSFFVTELSEHRPGEMDENLPLVQPSIGIVTVVRDDHSSKEYPREAIAAEMGKLIAALPATGTAVLNADDELVLAMAAKSVARVITYGLSPSAELRAEEISSVWPDRLQMTLVRGSRARETPHPVVRHALGSFRTRCDRRRAGCRHDAGRMRQGNRQRCPLRRSHASGDNT